MRSLIRHSHAYRLSLLLAIVCLTLATQNCDCQQGPAIPDTAEARLGQISETIPKEAGAVAMLGDLGSLRTASEQIEAKLGDIMPVGKMLEREFRSTFGIDLFEAKSWKKAGIAPDASLAIIDVGTRPVLLTYYKDKQAFESHLTERVQSQLGLKGAPSAKSVGDHKIKVLGKKNADRIAWGYRGRLVAVGFPPTGPGGAAPTVTSAIQTVLDTEPKTSIARQGAFQRFRSFASDHRSFVFFNTDALAERSLDNQGDRPNVARSARFLDQNLDGFGAVLDSTSSGLNMNLWVGLAEDVSKAIQTLHDNVTSTDWTHLATDQTLLGVRLGLEPGGIWTSVLEQSTKQQQRLLQRRLQRIGRALGIDLKKDVLDHLVGEMGLFFYGFGPNLSISDIQRDPIGMLEQTGLITAATFDSNESLRKTIQKLAEAHGFLNYRSLETEGGETVDAIKVLEFVEGGGGAGLIGMMAGGWGNIPVKCYVHDKQFVLSTTAIDETSMRGYLTGSRKEATPLAESDSLDLGATFASESKFNGLYFNVVRAHEVLKDKIPPLPSVNRFLTTLQELLISVEPGDRAAIVDVSLDRTSSKQ